MQANKHLEIQSLEEEILDFWKSEEINEELSEFRRGGKNLFLVHPPILVKDEFTWDDIYINIVFDVWSRYFSLKTYNVRNGIGFDPYNLRVEKISNMDNQLGNLSALNSEELSQLSSEIEDNSEKMIEETVEKFDDLGLWTTGEFDYKVNSEDYIDSTWWTINKLKENNLLNKKRKPVKWCPNCKASLTVPEISCEREIKDEILVKIPLSSGKDRYFLVEIKEPWKLPGLSGLLINPKEEYFIIKHQTENEKVEQLVVLKKNVEEIMDKYGVGDYDVVKTVGGKKLEGLEYIDPLYDELSEKNNILGKKRNIISSEDVEKEGTGIVSLTPPFDEEHWELAKKENVDIYNPLFENGFFEGGPRNNSYSGLSVSRSERLILDHLAAKNLILQKRSFESKTEKCDACRSKVINYPQREFFFDIKKLDESKQKEILESEEDQNGKLKNSRDILITRSNHWGIPFPKWVCNCGEMFHPSNRSELSERADIEEEKINPYSLKELEVECPKCEEKMVWNQKTISPLFLRMSSPWAQLGYPGEEKEYQSWWPGKISCDYENFSNNNLDPQKVLSKIVMDDSSIENRFNFVPITEEIEYSRIKDLVASQGYDTLRLTLLSENSLEEEKEIKGENFHYKNPIVKVTLNVLEFYLDSIERLELDPEELKNIDLNELETIEDRWLLSKIEKVKKETEDHYENGDFNKVIESLKELLVENFSQWYLSIAKSRIEKENEDRKTIMALIQRILMTISRLSSPITPFLSEKLYKELEGEKQSVFMEDWPKFEEDHIEENVLDEMKKANNIVEEILLSKRRSELPEKWPLTEAVYESKTEDGEKFINNYEHIIKNKAKIKDIRRLEEDEEWDEASLQVKPNRDKIAKSYQSWESKISTMLEQKSPEAVKEGIEKGEFTIGLQGQIIEIGSEMVDFEKEMPEGFEELKFEDLDLYIDLEVTDEIWVEEMLREIKLRLKSMRQDLNLESGDEIVIYISTSEEILHSLKEKEDEIKEEVGARNIVTDEEQMEKAKYILEWDINGELVQIGVEALYKTKVLDYYSKISGVDDETAESLYDSGFTTIDSLKEATASELSEIDQVKRSLARKIVNSLDREKEKEELEEKEDELEKLKEDASEKASEKGEYKEEEKDEEEETEDIEEKKVEKEKEGVKEEIDEEVDEVEEEPIGEEKEELPEDISKSSTYLILEKESDKSYHLFRDILISGERGLCVSRDYPDKIKEEYDLKEVEMIWLSNVDREDVIRPKSLEKLSLALENFLTKTGGVIMLKGLEYLITNNEFKTVLHLIQSIKDQVAINESILLIPINPSAMNDEHIDLVSGEVDGVIEH